MKIQCNHCGTSNDVEAALVRAGSAVCRRCQSTLTNPLDTAASAPPQVEPPDAAHAWLSALGEPAADLSALGVVTKPAQGLEALLGEPDPDLTQSAPMDFQDGGFLFDQATHADEDPTWLQGEEPINFDRRTDPNDGDSTRIVPSPGKRPMARPKAPSWRIRAERGLVYEMRSADAVVAWIEGRSEIHGITLAKGDGPFQSISAFDEIAKRIGKRASGLAAEDGPLSLALDREERPTVQAPKQAEVESERPRMGTSARTVVTIENPVGFGVVLAVILCAVLLIAGGGIASVLLTDLPPETIENIDVEPTPQSAQLTRAVGELEKGNNGAAAKILQGLSSKHRDPRVDRYLALALHRTGRKREAREALERYRRGIDRTRGHGRQVQEMRH